MEIITSHNSLDFDGLASMVAAGKLYPAAVKVFSGTLSKNVKQFMALYKDSLAIHAPNQIDLTQVQRMIVVDTANANRLGQLSELARRPDLERYIYDHHPPSPDDLPGEQVVIQQLGAATTILVEQIISRDIKISPFDATILALGIYEDTGSLLFTSTTARDVSVVAFLLGRGANLSVVANFIEQPFSSGQRQLLQELINSSRHYRIHNMDVVMAMAEPMAFIPGLDAVTFRLFEIENSDVVFAIALMEGKLNVVARSRTANLKVNEVLRSLGGRGHEKAASAVVKGKNAEEVVSCIIDALGEEVNPGLMARDIMSSPVKTVPGSTSMEEAGKIMLRYGHTGMPVVEDEQMVGVISRRDVDKARIHDLGHAPVKGFMSTRVVAVDPQTPLAEVQKLMVEKDIGRLPVLEGGRLLGIVSRTDILRTLHGQDYPEDHEVLYDGSENREQNLQALMEERLPSRLLSTLRLAGQIAGELGCHVYCVGGFIRDLLLRVPNFDVDLVVDGEGETLTRALAEHLGGKERVHERFHTGVVILPDGSKIDIATARTEYYEFPAALPNVEKSSMRDDLYRRDFTINTMAVCLHPDCFGDLIDYFGGRQDLEKGLVRILYNFSFVEDPTRILRAIRFEQRYRFQIEPDTLRFAQDAIERRLLGKLSYKRILQEIILILGEKDPVPSLDRMQEIGVWKYILPEVRPQTIDRTTLRRIPIVSVWWEERYLQMNLKTWLVFIQVILSQLNEEDLQAVMERYRLSSHAQKCLRESRQVEGVLAALAEKAMKPSRLDELIGDWSPEGIVYLLLSIHTEGTWDEVVHYLDAKEKARVEINGNDLKKAGVKPGPVFSTILNGLYKAKLDGRVQNRADELAMVQKWLKEANMLEPTLE
ncbi:MAG TPA: CBS domain-containing protein [Syntrophomonadaceae bacterium]|nr:CBS domain-containing protein [Syntrophomonadaceae bacterium]